jgi:lipopolysaccharide transport system ATP-binding protein
MISESVRGGSVKAEHVSKQYSLATGGATTLSEGLIESVRSLRRRGRREGPEEGFWALDDVSFELQPGEALGLVGANGAGKSTLLKILSRITAPTKGSVTIAGRIATLLEVGTGFHPELTGRENVFLNGSILGMRRREIQEKLDTIVDFSGIGRFLDMPVKHYSSGMGVRLAFSVAAHLDSDVLLIDEVLAVGDAEFQKKCLGKMHEVAGQGRAVVFVSHNLNAVQRLCDRALLIESGRLTMDGLPGPVVAEYLARSGRRQTGGLSTVADDVPRFGTGEVRIREIALTSLDGDPLTGVHFGQPVRISLVVESLEPIADAVFEVGVSSADGQRVLTAQSIDRERPADALMAGMNHVAVELSTTLLPTEYTLDVGVHRLSGVTMDYLEQVVAFTGLNVAESGRDHYPWPGVRGYVRPDSEWSRVSADKQLSAEA